MKILSMIGKITKEVPHMSSIVVGGMPLIAGLDLWVLRNANWDTVLLGFQQTGHAFRMGESSSHLLYYLALLFAVATGKLALPLMNWVFAPEFLKRLTTDRLRLTYWWSHGIECREARLAPTSLRLRAYRSNSERRLLQRSQS